MNAALPRRRPASLRCVAAVAAAVAAVGSADARAQTGEDAAAARRARGVRLAREGRCEPALVELRAARKASARPDPEAAVLAGDCLVRLGRYDDAVREYEIAAAAPSHAAGTDLGLAIAYYHLDRRADAARALERAERRDPDRAPVQLYKGLLALDRAEHREGSLALEAARSLDAGYADPVASYYEGLAYVELAERENAAAALERVVAGWPGTPWADEAQRALDRLEADEGGRFWVEATVGLEFDSNVALANGDPLISREEDGRALTTLSAGYELLRTDAWTLGAAGRYWGTKYFRETDFDADFPTVTLWLDRRLSDRDVARAEYEFGYAWLDGDEYLMTNGWRASLLHGWQDAGTTRLSVGYLLDDFMTGYPDVPDGTGVPNTPCPPPPPGTPSNAVCGPPGLDEHTARKRDGSSIVAGVEQALPLPAMPRVSSPAASVGYEYAFVDADGREWSHQSHSLWLGPTAVLPWEVVLETEVRFTYRTYDHPTTFPDNDTLVGGFEYALATTKRREREWDVGVALSRALTDALGVSLSWRYTDNDSSSKTFTYRRHVVGVALTGRLP